MFEKEAEGSAKKFFGKPTDLVDLDNLRIFKNGYLAGAEPREKRIAELEVQIEKMKAELHHRLISPSHDDSDCLDKIVGLDRLWQFGQEF